MTISSSLVQGNEPELPPNVVDVPADIFRKFHHNKRVGNYLLGRTLGEGSFAKVKEGMHVLTGEKVAIKVVDKKRAKQDSYVRKNMRREGRILQAIQKRLSDPQHPHIIQLYKIMETENSYYPVTELCRGDFMDHIYHPHIIQLYEIMETENSYYLVTELCRGDFMDHICKRKKLEEREVRKYIRQIVSAVDYLHRLGILHRDLKIENLLLDEREDIKIIDFGLSNCVKLHKESGRIEEYCSTQCGSPAYAAPELLGQKKYGTKVDVWSVGINMYAMLTGNLPFTVDPFNIKNLRNKMVSGQMNPIPDSLSRDGRDFLRKLLCPDPEKRLSLSDAMKHSWITEGTTKPMTAHPCPNRLLASHLNSSILRHMIDKQGLLLPDIVRHVTTNTPSNCTAIYHLWNRRLKRYNREEAVKGRVPSAIPETTKTSFFSKILGKRQPPTVLPKSKTEEQTDVPKSEDKNNSKETAKGTEERRNENATILTEENTTKDGRYLKADDEKTTILLKETVTTPEFTQLPHSTIPTPLVNNTTIVDTITESANENKNNCDGNIPIDEKGRKSYAKNDNLNDKVHKSLQVTEKYDRPRKSQPQLGREKTQLSREKTQVPSLNADQTQIDLASRQKTDLSNKQTHYKQTIKDLIATEYGNDNAKIDVDDKLVETETLQKVSTNLAENSKHRDWQDEVAARNRKILADALSVVTDTLKDTEVGNVTATQRYTHSTEPHANGGHTNRLTGRRDADRKMDTFDSHSVGQNVKNNANSDDHKIDAIFSSSGSRLSLVTKHSYKSKAIRDYQKLIWEKSLIEPKKDLSYPKIRKERTSAGLKTDNIILTSILEPIHFDISINGRLNRDSNANHLMKKSHSDRTVSRHSVSKDHTYRSVSRGRNFTPANENKNSVSDSAQNKLNVAIYDRKSRPTDRNLLDIDCIPNVRKAVSKQNRILAKERNKTKIQNLDNRTNSEKRKMTLDFYHPKDMPLNPKSGHTFIQVISPYSESKSSRGTSNSDKSRSVGLPAISPGSMMRNS